MAPQPPQPLAAFLAAEKCRNGPGIFPGLPAVFHADFVEHQRPVIRPEFLAVQKHVQQPVVLRLFEGQRAVNQQIFLRVVHLDLPAQLEHAVFFHGQHPGVVQLQLLHRFGEFPGFIPPHQNSPPVKFLQRRTKSCVQRLFHTSSPAGSACPGRKNLRSACQRARSLTSAGFPPAACRAWAMVCAAAAKPDTYTTA